MLLDKSKKIVIYFIQCISDPYCIPFFYLLFLNTQEIGGALSSKKPYPSFIIIQYLYIQAPV